MEQLPPLPEPDMSHEKARDDRDLEYSYSNEAMRSYAIQAADQAVALERERCARICDKRANFLASAFEKDDKHQWMREEAELCAAAIRKG